jgi:filamentous hemagglutinin
MPGLSPSSAAAIAKGHAWSNHRHEFPEFATPAEFARHIDSIFSNPQALVRKLARGRQAWWHGASRTVVIHDPNHPDEGTAFRPTGGKSYFDNLR